MRTYKVISADGHLEGPVDWTKWVPTKYKDAVPKLITRPDKSMGWRLDWAGVQAESTLGSAHNCGLPYDEYTPQNARTYYNPDGSSRPGCGGNVARLREQDIDGIDAEVIFFGSGAATGAQQMKNKDLGAYMAMVRAYNDYLADYCSIAPDRLIGNHVLPTTGVDDAIAEMERCKKMGLPSVCLAMWPNGSEDAAPEDDRFWAAALDMDMKLSPHQAMGAQFFPPAQFAQGPGPEQVTAGQYMTGAGRCQVAMGRLILHGVFDRFPKMKIHFAESQAAWLAAYLDGVDEFYQRWYTWHDVKLKKQPSQYIRDHVRFSFIYERMAMRLRQYIGVELLMWGSDFPHSVGTYPDSQETLDDFFENVPAEERRQVLVENPCEFYDLDPEKPLTPTP